MTKVNRPKLKFWELKQRQSLPYEVKVNWSKSRIRDFVYEMPRYSDSVYVAVSGGLGSLVTLNLVREIFPEVPAVHVSIECPENLRLVKSLGNVEIVHPEMRYPEVLRTEGYPVVSKKVARMLRDLQNPTDKNFNSRNLYLTGMRQDGTKSKGYKLPEKWRYLIDAPFKISERCCDIMKKNPLKKYEKRTGRKPIVGTMASESKQREISYLMTGCNTFRGNRPMCRPISIWFAEDVWQYINENNIKYSEIYDKGEKHTGCLFCMFGAHLEKEPTRFQRMAVTHPRLYDHYINKLKIGEILDYMNIPYVQKESYP